ncbi:hypothetical protein Tco_1573969 [Tanacetum coccineum]
MGEFDTVTAQQAALVAQLRVRFASERGQSVQKDEEILLLKTQLADAQAEAESSRSYAQKLAEEKMALLVKAEQERADAAEYKASLFSYFYNNTYLKNVQAFYAKELPISSQDPITPPAILTPSLRDYELSNPSRNQTGNLVSPSSSVYTPTPPQIFEIGKSSVKIHLKHHEEQIKDILNYLDELSFCRIEKMEEGRINRMITQRNSNELKTELKRIHTQIIKLQRKKLGQKDKIAFAHYRISNLERIIKKIQARHQTDQEDL